MTIEDELAVLWPLEDLTSMGSVVTVGSLREKARRIYLGGAQL